MSRLNKFAALSPSRKTRPIKLSRDRRFFRKLHRAFEFRRLFFNVEIFGMEIVDLAKLVRSQRRTSWRFRELNELFLIVNIRQC